MPKEYVYKLNFPSDVLLPDAMDKISSSRVHHSIHDAKDIFKPECLNWMGLKWETVYYFSKRAGQVGQIHSDCYSDDDSFECGINWVFGGDGSMEYWTEEELIHPEYELEKVLNLPVRKYEVPSSPSKHSYHMPEGVYLINGVAPHRGIGISGVRHVISLRSPDVRNKTWEEVVEMFKDYIVEM